MSTLTVRYFAALREQMGMAQEAVAVPADGVDLADLLTLLADCHGAVAVEALTGAGVRIAVNDELLVALPPRLRPGDVVAFLPPVTGG